MVVNQLDMIMSRRDELVRLLAEIDQQLKDYELLAVDESATPVVRAFAVDQVRLAKLAVAGVEKELSDLNQAQQPPGEN